MVVGSKMAQHVFMIHKLGRGLEQETYFQQFTMRCF